MPSLILVLVVLMLIYPGIIGLLLKIVLAPLLFVLGIGAFGLGILLVLVLLGKMFGK